MQEAEKNSPQVALLEAQARKTEVESDIKELQRDKLRDALLDAGEVSQYWEAHQERIRESSHRLPEVLPDDLYALMPDELRNELSQEQKDELVAAWRGIFERESIASTDC